MILREDGKIKSGLEAKEDIKPPLKVDNNVEYCIDGEILVKRCAFSVQIKEDEEQQENIFYTRCHIDNKVCS